MEPIRFVVPFGSAGAADRAARALALPDMAIENLPGAGGRDGVERANALAQGGAAVMLLGTPSTHILLPTRSRVGPLEAFAPLMGLGSAPNVLLVSPRLGVTTVAELVEHAHATPLIYASAGAGQTIHVCTALFCEQAGVRMAHRPYEAGSASVYEDFAAGRVDVYFDNLLGCRERIERGDAVPLAISATRRHPLLAGIPTLVECGFPHHALDVWLGVFGASLEARSLAAIERLRGDPAFAVKLSALGLSGGPSSAGDLARQVRDSQHAWMAALAAACPPGEG